MTLRRILRPSAPGVLLMLSACGGPMALLRGDPCEGAWMQLFDDARFSDQRLTVRYPDEHASLRGVNSDAGGRDLNDRVSSARWEAPPGCRAVLFEDENFRGTRFELVGSGRREENANLGSFNDKASSLRWERG
ncbi:MAG: beta/gamma crystallin family protein [Gemmatimonadota bacterium]|nr:beta/gamma crystallin family protein [Gemmatimonadota bacterium]